MKINESAMREPRCADAFGLLFWSYLFFIDLHLTIDKFQVDFLPDCIGWLMIISALGAIRDVASAIDGIRKLAIAGLVCSLFLVVSVVPETTHDEPFGFTFQWTGLPASVMGIISLVYTWKLCGVIMEMAHAGGNPGLASKASFRRILNVSLLFLGALLFPVAYLAPGLAVALLAVGAVLAITTFFLLMGLMRRTAHFCRRLRPLPLEPEAVPQ